MRSNTQSPCPRSAEVEILGVAFCGPCARQQEAYFSIGELTHEDGRDLHSKKLAEVLERKRQERAGSTDGMAATMPLGRRRDQTSCVQEELTSIDSFRRNSLPWHSGKDQPGRGSRSSHPGLLPEARSAWTRWAYKPIWATVPCGRTSGPSRACSSATTTCKAALRSYGTSGAGSAEESWFSRDRIRGVSHPHEVSKMLTFPFRPRLVCSSLLHLRSSQKVNSRKFDLARAAAPCLHFLPYGRLLSGADKLPAPPPASPLLLLPTSSVVWS